MVLGDLFYMHLKHTRIKKIKYNDLKRQTQCIDLYVLGHLNN